jgi:chromosome segregation ATPase
MAFPAEDFKKYYLKIMLVGQRIITAERFDTVYNNIVVRDITEINRGLRLAAKLKEFKDLVVEFKNFITAEIKDDPKLLPVKDLHYELIKNTINGITTNLPESVDGTGATHSVISEMLNLSEHIMNAEGEYDLLIGKLQSMKETEHENNMNNKIIIDNLIRTNESLVDEQITARENLIGAREELAKAKEALSGTEKQRDNLQTQLTSAQGTLSETEDRLATTETQRDNLQTQLTSAQGTLSEIEDKLAKTQDELKEAQDERDNLQTQLTSAQTERDNLRTERDSLQTQLTSAQTERDSLQRQLTSIQQILGAPALPEPLP